MVKWSGVREIPGLVLTAARYGLAERISAKVRADEPIALGLAAFIATDIADGAILREFALDTPARRVTDGIVDHLSVARVGYEVGKKHPETHLYLGILAARAALVGAANFVHLLKTGEVTKGRSKQKAANLASAAFALVALSGNKKATHIAGSAASVIALATAIPHVRGVGTKHANGVREL